MNMNELIFDGEEGALESLVFDYVLFELFGSSKFWYFMT